jgi:molybdopterin-containing oxidoreductase family iron-sulfur binding subunit
MEKCTFCIHKIKNVKILAKADKRELKDGDVVTACQASCPSQAIQFGDVNDPESKVSKSLKEERSYSLLEDLNTVPAIKYKTKIRNTEHLVADANAKGGH